MPGTSARLVRLLLEPVVAKHPSSVGLTPNKAKNPSVGEKRRGDEGESLKRYLEMGIQKEIKGKIKH